MARPRRSTVENLKRGTYTHDPARILNRLSEPIPTELLGDPPKHLDREAKSSGASSPRRFPPGVATNADGIAFELLVELVGRQRAGRLQHGERTQLLRLLAQFGLTPTSRPKVSAVKVEEPKEKDEFSEFMQDEQT